LIDEKKRFDYLAHQIEPESEELYGSVEKAQELNRNRAARLNW